MLIKGNNSDFIKDGNTLSDDQFKGQTFDYILSNPPFGREWKNEKAKVEEEAKLGFGGRFGAGLSGIRRKRSRHSSRRRSRPSAG